MLELMHFHLRPEFHQFYDRDLMIYSESAAKMSAPTELKDSFTVAQILGLDHCCSVCQGILQVIDQDYFADCMAQRVKREDFEFESFKFSVHAPLSSTFRYFMITIRLLHRNIATAAEIAKDPEYTEEDRAQLTAMLKSDNPIELKTVIKWVLAPLLARKLNCSSNLNEDFNILMTFANEGDDQELVDSYYTSSNHSENLLTKS